MYKDYFRLSEMPFSISPDPRFLFMSERHREALAHLLYGVQGEGGIVLFTGEVGTGKTTVCRCLLEQLPANIDVAFVLNPRMNTRELLQTICEEFHIALAPGRQGVKVFVDAIYGHLLDANARGRRSLLIIDEAQNLDPKVLELLRLMTNLETNTRKLLQILLIGQPELQDLLARPEMRQVAQRVVARYHLSQLSVTEISAYVAHRLRVSGAAAEIFPQSLMKPIFRASGGVPRLINLVCDRALLGTYVGGRQRVTAPTLRQAVREVIAARRPRWHWWPLAAGLMAAAGLVLAEATGLIHAASAWLPWPSTVPLVSSAAPPSPRPESPQPTPTRSNFSEPPEAERTPVLYRNDESGIAAPGPSASVEWPNGILPVNSEAMAFQSLLKRYGMVVDIAAKGDPCRQVEDLGMRCYAGRGGLSDLTLLDQPVVMRLSSAEGHDYSVTLVGLDRVNHVATLLIGDEERRVALRDLAIVWSGRYYAIWKAPRAFHDSLAINQRGPAISWLRQILSTVDGIDDPGTDKFDAALARRIRAFQLAEGIQPDGLVGPLTAIRLNVRSGQLGPRLTAGKGD